MEELVYCQLENLNAMHDLLRIMKTQNELLDAANQKLQEQFLTVPVKLYGTTRNKTKNRLQPGNER